MPASGEPNQQRSLQAVVNELDRYPIDAFLFVQQGLGYAVTKLHGPEPKTPDPTVSRHINGQQLCEGLREFALLKWGMLARTVLRRWSINSTIDFGQIVFAMVESGLMQKTERDSIEDFRDVYDFRTAFEAGYQIPLQDPAGESSKGRT
jgi:uncharacterized repeat protein (TIGR04138 family)